MVLFFLARVPAMTDAKKNLRDSVVCAIDPGSRGVMVVFGGHVIAGTRAKKNKTISYDAFASVNFPELALVQTTLSRRFFLASVISLEMGCCAPVRMMGLSAFWMR